MRISKIIPDGLYPLAIIFTILTISTVVTLIIYPSFSSSSFRSSTTLVSEVSVDLQCYYQDFENKRIYWATIKGGNAETCEELGLVDGIFIPDGSNQSWFIPNTNFKGGIE